MITVSEAHERVAALLQPVATEEIALHEAGGRVLAQDVTARRSQPPFASSAMDGYAVRRSDIRDGAVLKVVGESAAGDRFSENFGAGECVRIFTGAPVPADADAVVIQEDTVRSGDLVTLHADANTRRHIREAGSDFGVGDRIEAPRLLQAADLALLAAMNVPRLRVYRRPVVALVATGDELVMPGDDPGPDQIVSSNSFGLKAMLEREGAECRILPIARDTAESLNAVLDLCADADLMVTVGGASVGDRDIVRDVLESRGLEVAFHRIALRPGKPVLAGKLGDKPLIGLPGNPVSAMICARLFAVPALAALQGLPMQPPVRESAKLATPLPPNASREHYMRARVVPVDGGWTISTFEVQDSALLSVLSQANALLVRPPLDEARQPGEAVQFIRM
ncbi:MAG: gephyrin-like molybdotransferase Glp [Paracoccaceae bacterium]